MLRRNVKGFHLAGMVKLKLPCFFQLVNPRDAGFFLKLKPIRGHFRKNSRRGSHL